MFLLHHHFLSLLTFSLLVLTPESRSINDAGSVDIADAAIDLNSTNFVSVLQNSPANFAAVEFYAHWCPACRNYKPHYEKVARLFNGPNAVHPGIILMARVDCADKINTDLCSKFSVDRYPIILWGPPLKFTAGRWDSKQKDSGIVAIDDARTADRLLTWINKKIGSSYSLDDQKYENENSFSRNASNPDMIARAIYDVEEATAHAFEIIVNSKMIKVDTRAPFIKFLQLLVVHHPSPRCRRGTAELLVNIDDLLPANFGEIGVSVDRDIFKTYSICGNDVPRGYWIFCRGSKKETRGFSCGLWVLFHSLSVRVGDGESHFAFTSICEFIQNFFVCDECRMHFGEMCSSVQVPFNTTQSLALWLWNAHNKVNKRLMKVEEELQTGDPSFPKLIWPTKQLCPSCYLPQSSGSVDTDWNYNEVYNFLVKYYGTTLASSLKDKGLIKITKDESNADESSTSSHAVSVPVGAALAIALVSCAFGALAYFWRTRQKNRKPRKNWHKIRTEMSSGVLDD